MPNPIRLFVWVLVSLFTYLFGNVSRSYILPCSLSAYSLTSIFIRSFVFGCVAAFMRVLGWR